MKKHILFLVLISLILSIANTEAQSKYKRKLQPQYGLGIRAGVNYSSQSTAGGSTTVDVQSIIGYNAGAYINYFLLDVLAVQTELTVNRKGVHWHDPYYDANDLLTYIDLPILIKYQPVSILNIHAGPEFGYRLAATQKNLDTKLNTNIKEYYKNFDVGIAFGIEATLPININITIRYVLGITPVTQSTQYDQPWKNNFFQISAGYRIFGK
jgi:hypothetical protein